MAEESSGKANDTGRAAAASPPTPGGEATGGGLRPAVWATGLILIAAVLPAMFAA